MKTYTLELSHRELRLLGDAVSQIIGTNQAQAHRTWSNATLRGYHTEVARILAELAWKIEDAEIEPNASRKAPVDPS